jgi:hypothetical protein
MQRTDRDPEGGRLASGLETAGDSDSPGAAESTVTSATSTDESPSTTVISLPAGAEEGPSSAVILGDDTPKPGMLLLSDVPTMEGGPTGLRTRRTGRARDAFSLRLAISASSAKFAALVCGIQRQDLVYLRGNNEQSLGAAKARQQLSCLAFALLCAHAQHIP